MPAPIDIAGHAEGVCILMGLFSVAVFLFSLTGTTPDLHAALTAAFFTAGWITLSTRRAKRATA